MRIGLNMDQVELPLFDDGLMDLFTVASCTISPFRYGSFI
jgi:hypothetical protein